MEGQRGEVTCLSLHSISVVELLIGVDIRVNPKLGLLDLSTPCSLLKNAEYLPTMHQAPNSTSRGHREE